MVKKSDKKKTAPEGSSREEKGLTEKAFGKDGGSPFVEEVISVRRVAKVVKGGRRLVFSVFVVVGDGCGKIGLGSGKGREVAPAVSKAFKRAKKSLVEIPLQDTTIPFDVTAKFGASKVLVRAARKGTGVIAGGAVRLIMSALGVRDVLSKSLGSSNPINVAYATVRALKKLQSLDVLQKVKNDFGDNAQAQGSVLVQS